MKKFLVLFLLFCPLLFCGCVKSSTTITFDKSGSVFVKDLLLAPQEVDKNFDYRFTTIKQEDKADNVKIEPISFDNQVGLKKETTIKNVSKEDITNLQKCYTTNNPNKRFVDVKKHLFFNDYIIDINGNFTKNPDNGEDFADLFFNTAFVKFQINIPVKAKTTNATSIEEKDGYYIYKWDFDLKNPKNNIAIKFRLWKMLNISLFAIISAIILIVVFLRRKKSK